MSAGSAFSRIAHEMYYNHTYHWDEKFLTTAVTLGLCVMLNSKGHKNESNVTTQLIPKRVPGYSGYALRFGQVQEHSTESSQDCFKTLRAL